MKPPCGSAWTLSVVAATAICMTGIAVSQNTRPGATTMTTGDDGISHIPVQMTGGHDTDPRDHGRPVVLIAAALNVPTDVFRKAFTGVTPAPQYREPTGGEARQNKAALLKVLSPYGVTNDRLDEVSDRYRYRPGSGRRWTHTDADIRADVRDGKIVGFTVVNAGAGYTTPPEIAVTGFSKMQTVVKLKFSTDLEINGSIQSIKLSEPTRN